MYVYIYMGLCVGTITGPQTSAQLILSYNENNDVFRLIHTIMVESDLNTEL